MNEEIKFENTFISDPQKFTIRNIDEEDIKHYCLLFQSIFESPPWFEKWAVKRIDSTIRKHIRKKGFIGMVAKSDSRTIGYIIGFPLPLISQFFYLDQLFVDSALHGKGTGKKLLANITLSVKKAGFSGIILLTKPDSIAENFYISNGFTKIMSLIRIRGKNFFYKTLKPL